MKLFDHVDREVLEQCRARRPRWRAALLARRRERTLAYRISMPLLERCRTHGEFYEAFRQAWNQHAGTDITAEQWQSAVGQLDHDPPEELIEGNTGWITIAIAIASLIAQLIWYWYQARHDKEPAT